MSKNKKSKRDILDKMFVIFSVVGFILLFFLIRNVDFDFLYYDLESVNNKTINNTEVRNVDYFAAGVSDTEDPFVTRNIKVENDFLAKPILDGSDPSLGSDDAIVNIVEFSDLTCEFCREQESVIRKVMEKYKGKVRLVWKYYPNSFGPSLRVSAAAYCAHEQDKFWEFQDLFFKENADNINTKLFLNMADKLGLDRDRFNSCIDNEKSFDMIMKDIREANALQIAGVPFFFIGDQEILGEINKDELERIIEIELNK